MDCADFATTGFRDNRSPQPPACMRRSTSERTYLDNSACRWHQDATALLEPASAYETVSAQAFHMVERPDLWHAIVDLAVRRTGGRRRAGQPLLPHQGPQDRSVARLRAALGGLQRLCRGDACAAVMAWLAASHRRCRADRRDLK